MSGILITEPSAPCNPHATCFLSFVMFSLLGAASMTVGQGALSNQLNLSENSKPVHLICAEFNKTNRRASHEQVRSVTMGGVELNGWQEEWPCWVASD